MTLKSCFLNAECVYSIRTKNPNESIISEPELKPWTSLSIGNFEYKGRHYLIILDRCTKFVVVKCIHSYDAGKTVETMCEVFSKFGLPENIHSDRGRNFLSNQFTQFLNTLGIDLTFCSSYHHSSNPAERAIRNVKNLMKHCASAGKFRHIALLEYLATLLSTGIPSPAAMRVGILEDFYLIYNIFLQIVLRNI